LEVFAALMSAGLTLTSFRRRHKAPAAAALAATMMAVVVSSLVSLLIVCLVTARPASGLRSALISVAMGSLVLWASVIATTFMFFSRRLASPAWRPRRRTLGLLAVEPAVAAAVAIMDPWLHLGVARWWYATGDVWPRWVPGPMFWPLALYSYGLSVLAEAVLLRALRHRANLARRQLLTVITASGIPALSGMLAAVMFRNRSGPDLMTAGFAIGGAVQAYAVFRQGVLGLVHVARSHILEHLGDGIVVLDAVGQLIDINPAARHLLGLHPLGLPGPLAALAAQRPVQGGTPADLAPPGQAGPIEDGEYAVPGPRGRSVVDVRSTAMADQRGRVLARIVVLRDVTELASRRAELAAANDNLQQQISTVEALQEELAEQAFRDELTGLHNRRYLVSALEREMAGADRDGGSLALVIFDLDHFKNINDTYGHDVGDTVLAAAARALRSGLRPDDVLTRYGGEEFVALLRGVAGRRAAARAEDLRHRCAEVLVETPLGPVGVTASVGVADFRPGDTVTVLLKAADRALYAAKAAGRDRVELARRG
jgi:diguanylate cyclase (GGDEF)-like protein